MSDEPGDKDGVVLDCHVGDDKMISITMAGDISLSSPERILRFERWASAVKQAMREVSAMNAGRVLTLIDAAGVTHFDVVMTEHLRELMEFNRDYATRTAVFGATTLIRTLVRAILVLTHRTTMKLFSTREEALAWLAEDKEAEEKEVIG